MDRVPWRPATYHGRTNSGRNEGIPSITGPQARSRDTYIALCAVRALTAAVVITSHVVADSPTRR